MNNMTPFREVFFLLPALHGGGAERVTLSLLRAFQASTGWRPVLVLTTRHKGLLDEELPEDIEVIRLGASRGLAAIPKLLWLLRQRKPDVVFTSLDHVNSTMGLLQPLLPRRTRLVMRATSFRSLGSSLMRRLLRHAFLRADLAVFQSDKMREGMMEQLSLPADHHNVVVANPLDKARILARAAAPLAEVRPSWPGDSPEMGPEGDFAAARRLRLVAVGGLYWAKGFDLLIEAIRLLKRDDIRLVILGQGEQEAQLRQQILDAGVADRVRLAGFQPNPYPWLRQADGFVLSSRVEGFPNVVLEALTCDCPVVATPVPGLEEMPGVCLSDSFTAEDLARAIAAFAEAPHDPEADKVLPRFEISAVQRRYETLFDSLIERS